MLKKRRHPALFFVFEVAVEIRNAEATTKN
jgi:hypothetical protein